MKTKKIVLAVLFLLCATILSACMFLTPKYNITFVDYDGSVLLELTVEDGAMPEYTLENPTRESTAQYSYEFVGWDKKIVPAKGDLTYKAIYNETINKYKVIFADEDGTVLETQNVEYGKKPFYSGSTPTKNATAEYTYAFEGWNKEIAPVTGDVTYTAVYGSAKNEYKITFIDLEGNILYEAMVKYGDLPEYVGVTPTLEGNAQYSYVFTGWTPVLEEVKGVATYRPEFEQVVNEYEITFKDDEGNVLQSCKVPYGTVPAFTGTLPLPEDTNEFDYSGSWDKEIVPVTGEATYTYLVTKEIRTYTVTFKNGDVVLSEKEYTYGQVPLFDLGTPYKASTSEYVYTFGGWDKNIAEVTEDTTYTATYTEAANTYSVVIDHVTVEGFLAQEPYTATLTEEKLYRYDAPVIEGKQASHKYLNYRYEGEKVLITIYYSEVSVWDGTSVSTEFVGAGTAENPYLISSGADLALIREKVNSGDVLAGKHFKMTKSIDLNNHSLMIGDATTSSGTKPPAEAFSGIFDGNNCALLNTKTVETLTGSYTGIFKVIAASGKVCNLSTYGAYSQSMPVTGVITGINCGIIENCTNYVSVTIPEGVSPAETHRYTSAIAAVNNGTIISCVNYGNIHGEQYSSGMVSVLNAGGVIQDCINYGTVTSEGDRAAGICSEAKGGSITGCINYGDITSTKVVYSNSLSAGILGYTTANVPITNCINYGDVTGNGQFVGGISGGTKAVVSGCVNYGNIKGKQWVGGIVGHTDKDIINCANNGNVTGTADFVGGIVGASGDKTSGVTVDRTISGCVNHGAIQGTNFIGGIDGRPYAGNLTVDNCENNGTVTATSSYAGGILGRTDVAKAVLTNCKSNGAVSATYPGAYVGLDKASDTTGCTIDASCTSTLENMFYIGYDALTGYPGGGLTTEFENTDKVDIISGGFYNADESIIKSFSANNVGIIKNMSLTEGEFSTLVTLSSGVKAGIIFGYSKTDAGESYYRVVFADDSDRVYVEKVVDGVVTELAAQYLITPKKAGEFEFRVVIEDGKAYCYFWGGRLWAIIDMELTGTGVGFYAEHMGSEFRSYKVTEGAKHTTVDTLIIGHSYMDFWSGYKADLADVATEYNLGEVFNIGNGGSRANHWLSLKDCVAAYGADRIIYMIGINDISGSRAPETIVAEIEELLNYLKGVNPDLEVILFAVNHATSRTSVATQISATNDLMEELCSDKSWLYFADIEYAFCDENGAPVDSWFTDGLHITTKAYQEKIVPAIAAGCAYYEKTSHTVRFVDEQGNVLQETELEEGEIPVFTGILPTLPADNEYNSYSGAWDKEFVAVTESTTYTYVITKNILKPYNVEIMHLNLDGTTAAPIHYDNYVEGHSALQGNGTYLYTAPVVEGKSANRQYLYLDPGEEILSITIWYSEVDVWDGTSVSASLQGSGTAEDPYLIQSGADLAYLRDNAGTYASNYIKLTKSIDISANGNFMINTTFSGTFDGNNCSILGLNITGKEKRSFFFIVTGTVKDLTMYGSVSLTGNKAAAFAEYVSKGKFINCANYCSVSGKERVGGIAGDLVNGGTFTNCVNYGTINGSANVGGIVGYAAGNSVYEGCINYGTVNATTKLAGGIGGRAACKSFNNCVNYGNVTSALYAGAITGQTWGIVSNCFNHGTITAPEFPFEGVEGFEDYVGLVGYLVDTIDFTGSKDYGTLVISK